MFNYLFSLKDIRINQHSFTKCNKLTKIDILSNISNHQFQLTEISIPVSITSIGPYAFHDCFYLELVNLHSGITEIGNHAFSECKQLVTIHLPEKLTSIQK